MKRKAFSLVLALMCLVIPALKAQQLTPMPLNPEVKSGVLPNGLSYYVLHNEEPKGRANFYIAQKVGSTLETPEQLGLAHFLEHMAFNGTEHYPGKSMLEYLQSKGVRFGADINAYTSFDETVYNLNNIPTSDNNLMDSVLLVLRDWSGSILLETSEIDAERGVIQEEWRSRNDARTRMLTQILPQVFEEYQYKQMPIGSMDVVMNFHPQALREYYKKWYRPDQQGIVVVGDFDAAKMESKIVEMFSTIPMPENAAPRTYPSVSDNEEPIYATFEDPEYPNDVTIISFKYDKTPVEQRNTIEKYLQDGVLQLVISQLLNNRLNEYGQKPEAKYAYAGVRFGDYYVAKTKGAFMVTVVSKGNMTEAVEDAMAVVARACKTGFTDSELSRVRDELIASYEKLYNERKTTDNDNLGMELIRHFIDNEPAPGIEMEYMLVQQVLPMLPVQELNEYATTLLTPNNQVIVVSQHQQPGKELPGKEDMLNAVNKPLNTEYEVYVDEVITEPLISRLPPKGSIISEKDIEPLGAKELMLSNGAKVVVKPTDFSSDEIILTAYCEGGKRSYDASQAADVLMAEDAFEASKIGPFNPTQLQKYLAGKKVALSYKIGTATNFFAGQSTVKDLPALIELLYASFTDLGPDPEYYASQLARMRPMMENLDKNPMYVFQTRLNKDLWNHNPLMVQPTLSTLDEADYDRMVQLIKASTANAADYTFIFTGNVDMDQLRPLLEHFVASLPSAGTAMPVAEKTPIAVATGKINDTFELPMQVPSVVVYHGIDSNNLEYNMENDVRLGLVSDILDIIYTNTLREEEGGTYGASVNSTFVPYAGQWLLYYVFQTNAEQMKTLSERAIKELQNLLANGANPEDFNKVREAAIAQYDIQSRNNSAWDSQILSYLRGYDLLTGRREYLQSITVKDFNSFMSGLYDGLNEISVVMEGTQAQ